MQSLRLPILALLAFSVACASAPRFQGMTADELFRVAEREYQEEDWDEAIEALELLVVSFPTYERLPEVRLMIGRAYFNDEKYFTAQQEFTRFLDRYRGHEEAPEAALMMCRSHVELSPIPQRDQTYTRQAALVCQSVHQDYTGVEDEVAQQASEYVNQMRFKLGEKAYTNAEFYFSRRLYDSAIIYFETVVDEYGDTVWAPRALAGIIQAYEVIGYEEEVERYRQQLLNSYPESPEAQVHAEAAARPDTAGVSGLGSR